MNQLKEPISEFGRVLKETAIRYGNPKEGNAKKLYMIPLKLHTQGFGQPHGVIQYASTASSTIEIDRKGWYCWELDGTNKEGLKSSSSNYKHILRALLEGGLEIFVWSYDTVTGEKEYVGSFGIVSGALAIDQLVFTSPHHHRVFSGLNSHDETFYSEMAGVMNIFMRFSLPLAPMTKESEPHYDFIF